MHCHSKVWEASTHSALFQFTDLSLVCFYHHQPKHLPIKICQKIFLEIIANLCIYFLSILCLSNIGETSWKMFTFQWQSARQRIGCIIRIVCRCNFVNLNNFDNLNNFVNLYKVNSCLASYSPRPTTSNQPTYRAPNEAPKPICDQESIWPFLGQTS